LYISIDLNKLRFLHKHESFNVVATLDYIACVETNLSPVDSPASFSGLTDQDLSLLYRHTTGAERPPVVGDSLRMVLVELAERFPVTDADPDEVEAQASHIESTRVGGREKYAYVKGSRVPKRTDDVLFAADIPFTDSEARSAVQKHGQRLQQRAAALAAATPAPSPSAPAAPRKAATASRPRSGVCGQIWEMLDKERAEKNEIPTRNRVKELAAQFGWNPSTASVQFAAWRREKNLP
jgi:hypothetical protein